MSKILIFLFVGISIGYFMSIESFQKNKINTIRHFILKYNGKVQTLGVILLLFTMGVSIGINNNLISQLSSIGMISLSFSILTCLFSIIAVYFVSKKFLN